MKPNLVPALILIAVGALLLANNLIPEFRITDVVMRWWPAVLIILGISMLFRGNQR